MSVAEAPASGNSVTIAGRRVAQIWLDLAIGIALAVAGALETLRLADIPAEATTVEALLALGPTWLIIISGLSLTLRRYFPMAVLVITASGLIVSPLIDDAGSGWVAFMLAAFSAGLQSPRRVYLIGGFAALAAVDLAVWISSFGTPRFDPVLPALVALAAAFVWAGMVLRARTRQAAELQAHAVRLELEREREAERAATAERARIARELHDVIAHSLSVMVIQASAARRVWDDDPARAHEALDAVEETGRAAMVEMRRLLGVVRREEGEGSGSGAPRTPQPSMESIDRLVADMGQAGLDVRLEIDGERRPLPPGVDVSAYRIVQEALTNALRHAPGAATRVDVRYRRTELEIEVIDDGGSRVGSATATDSVLGAGGHGLAGMRERVNLLRGHLEAGPRAEGGFRVFARLPLGAS